MTSFNYNAEPSPASTPASTPCSAKGQGQEHSEQLLGLSYNDRSMKGKRKLIFPTESFTPVTPPQSRRRIMTGNCFNCKQPGHWRNDCPSFKSKHNLTITSNSHYPDYHCPCGHGVCKIVVKKSNAKSYYICPIKRGIKCGFPKQCEVVIQKGNHNIPPAYMYPECACGAGVCRKETCHGGPAAGRNCFVCPVRKGHGACSFFLLEDAFFISKSNIVGQETKTEGVRSFLDGYGIGSESLGEGCEMALNRPEIMKQEMVYDIECLQSTAIFDSRRENTKLIAGTAGKTQKMEPTVMSISTENLHCQHNFQVIEELLDLLMQGGRSWGTIVVNPLKRTKQTTSIVLHRWQKEFLRQCSAHDYAFSGKFLLNGWFGRLLYRPSLCLAWTLCGPSNHCKSLPSNSIQGTPLTAGDFSGMSCIKCCQSQWPESGRSLTCETHLLAAKCVQNELQRFAVTITLPDEEFMKTVATFKFVDQERLSIDYETMSEHVADYAHSSTSSMVIEQSSGNCLSDEELDEQLDALHWEHTEAEACVRESEQRLKLLQDEVSRVNGFLHDIENWDS